MFAKVNSLVLYINVEAVLLQATVSKTVEE
jgi:hypothetical protein